VVQPAEHRDHGDRRRDPNWFAFHPYRKLLADPLVRPSRVEVARRIFGKDAPKVRLGQMMM
jgi:hypothetical protein